jgi:hypothetical protein
VPLTFNGPGVPAGRTVDEIAGDIDRESPFIRSDPDEGIGLRRVRHRGDRGVP